MLGRWKRLIIPTVLMCVCVAALAGLDSGTLDAPHAVTLTGGQVLLVFGCVIVGFWLLVRG